PAHIDQHQGAARSESTQIHTRDTRETTERSLVGEDLRVVVEQLLYGCGSLVFDVAAGDFQHRTYDLDRCLLDSRTDYLDLFENGWGRRGTRRGIRRSSRGYRARGRVETADARKDEYPILDSRTRHVLTSPR